MISDESVRETFCAFDQNGDGKISAPELRRILEGNKETENSVWDEMIKQVDIDGDGSVT